MKLSSFTITRIAVPVLAVVGFILYHAFDQPYYAEGGPMRWPGVAVWALAAVLVIGYNIQNKNRPRNLLAVATLTLTAALLSFGYALYGAHGFDGIGVAVYISLPLAGLSILLFLASLYVGRPSGRF